MQIINEIKKCSFVLVILNEPYKIKYIYINIYVKPLAFTYYAQNNTP